MNRGIALLALSGLVYPCAQAQEPVHHDLVGFVTRATSGSDFDVDGIRILCGDRTTVVDINSTNAPIAGCPISTPYVGEQLKIDGSRNKKAYTLTAKRIENTSPQLGDVSGSAVIDALPAQGSAAAGELLVRADGYPISITGKTETTFGSPLQSLADIKPGVWIEYKAARRDDGVLVAKHAKLTPNDVGQGEEKLRTKKDYDPAAVPADSKQSGWSKAFKGIDPKKIPPYPDAAMQARVSLIGQKLIPAYLLALPDSDPAKINFRFQLIESPKWSPRWHDAFALPSGVILVPHKVVEHLRNDSQLAAVLADKIACTLEKQQFRMQTEIHALDAVYYGSVLVPFAGPAIQIGASVRENDLLVKARHQSGRVSLGLLHDAGYDIDEAPKAWWLLALAESDALDENSLPERASYLYNILGTTWHNPVAASAPAENLTLPLLPPE